MINQKFNYGRYYEIYQVLSLENESIAIFRKKSSRSDNRYGKIKLGYNRTIDIDIEEAFIIWEGDNHNKLEKIEFQKDENGKWYFDLPALLKKRNISYNLNRSGEGCVGKWNQSVYSYMAMITQNGYAIWINYSNLEWGTNWTLCLSFLKDAALKIGGEQINYIKISDYHEHLGSEDIEKAIEYSFSKTFEISWKEFGQYLDRFGLDKIKNHVSVCSDSGWIGRPMNRKEIPWEDETV